MNPNERRRKRRALTNTGQQATQGQYGQQAPVGPAQDPNRGGYQITDPGYVGGQYGQQAPVGPAQGVGPNMSYGGPALPSGGYGINQPTYNVGPTTGQGINEQGGYGTGFMPQGVRQQQAPAQAPPNFSHQQLSGRYGVNIPTDTRHQTRMFRGQVVGGAPQPQATRPNRYGQNQGFGQGYIAPRRSLGDQHRTAPQRTAASAGRGYNPRTSAQMYGGRPRGVARPRQMNQMQAMTKPAVGAGTYVGRPYGGTNAVTRRRW